MTSGGREAGLRGRDVQEVGRERASIDDSDIANLDGTAADATITTVRALLGSMALTGFSRDRLARRIVADLVRPAHEGAGEQQAGQKGRHETAHGRITPIARD